MLEQENETKKGSVEHIFSISRLLVRQGGNSIFVGERYICILTPASLQCSVFVLLGFQGHPSENDTQRTGSRGSVKGAWRSCTAGKRGAGGC